ncbi:MAG: GNAT family N-acetyltransferase [Clostridia bacterium]|nr:GNAT family N-acetyltransferase [Clostridia bacterium]
MIRLATEQDLAGVVRIYNRILDLEAAGQTHTGWQAGIYPTEATARDALGKGELFIMEKDGELVAAAKLNQEQVPEYAGCAWEFDAPAEQVMVLHTLVVDPGRSGKGYASEFVRFYEDYARAHGCPYLRMDTNASNRAARTLYQKLGYREPGIVACDFNGIAGVQLVCLEKKLDH